MIEVQAISACLDRRDFSWLKLNDITCDYFKDYKLEFKFIEEHVKKFGNVPDVATFLQNFPEFTLIEVLETEQYLVDQLRENYVYNNAVKILQDVSKKFKNSDSREAVGYLLSKVPELNKDLSMHAVELINQYDKRYDRYVSRVENPENAFITTGEKELDAILGGGIADNDNVLLAASTGTGKTWWAIKLGIAAAASGKIVGYYSGEMSSEDIGYRLDTAYSHISNYAITRGLKGINERYKDTLLRLNKEVKGKFYVITPEDLGGAATVSKLDAFVDKYGIEYLIVDQVSLLQDDHKTNASFDAHRNLARDLNLLRVRKGIRLLNIGQLNRGAKQKDVGDPDTQHIAGSNAYAEYATLILTVRQQYPNTLEIKVVKHRSAPTGSKLTYSWKIDTFELNYIKTEDDALHFNQITELRSNDGIEAGKEKYNDNYSGGADIF